MTTKAAHPCNAPNCSALTSERFCSAHKKAEQKRSDLERGTAKERGYDSRWAQARLYFLRFNPVCVKCKKSGALRLAHVVDHIVPHRGDYEKFWNRSNWQALCKSCHDRKTATEDGGFGNKK